MTKAFLVRHLGNMGDMIFFIPPVLETLKKRYPDCHITFVTAWGFKIRNWKLEIRNENGQLQPRLAKKDRWGERNQGGFCIELMMENPHIDQLVHWHDTKLSIDGSLCQEEGKSFPTWSKAYYEEQKRSGKYDAVYELDFGIKTEDNPIQRMYEAIGFPEEIFSDYKLYLTDRDKKVAASVMENYPRPRIVLLEGIEGTTTRGWDPAKVKKLEAEITRTFGVSPILFGGRHQHFYEGRPLTLRENIATLLYGDVGIGVMSGPVHFAAAVGLPTITLYGDQPLHRAAPAYFLNEYISDSTKKHRTILGPTRSPMKFLKEGTTKLNLTPAEWKSQGYRNWNEPGRQATKSCMAVITVDEVMTVLSHVLNESLPITAKKHTPAKTPQIPSGI